jgi:hypothetical protein
MDNMFAGSFYFGPAGSKDWRTFQQVVPDEDGNVPIHLLRNANYDFVFKLAARVEKSDSVINSIVAVQIKHRGSDEFALSNTKPAKVILERDGRLSLAAATKENHSD